MGALGTFLMVFFEAKGFNYDKAKLSTFFFLLLLLPFAVVAKKLLSNSHPQRFTSVFSSKNCIILTLLLKSVIHFEFMFMCI